MLMKTKVFADYLSPKFEVVTVSAEGVLCSSGPKGFDIDDMEVKPGGAGTDWDWE